MCIYIYLAAACTVLPLLLKTVFVDCNQLQLSATHCNTKSLLNIQYTFLESKLSCLYESSLDVYVFLSVSHTPSLSPSFSLSLSLSVSVSVSLSLSLPLSLNGCAICQHYN